MTDNNEKLRVIAERMGWALRTSKIRLFDDWYETGLASALEVKMIVENDCECCAALLSVWRNIKPILGFASIEGKATKEDKERADKLDKTCRRAITDGSIQDLTNALFEAIQFINSIKK